MKIEQKKNREINEKEINSINFELMSSKQNYLLEFNEMKPKVLMKCMGIFIAFKKIYFCELIPTLPIWKRLLRIL